MRALLTVILSAALAAGLSTPMSACTATNVSFFTWDAYKGKCGFGDSSSLLASTGHKYAVALGSLAFASAAQCGVCYEIVGAKGAITAVVADTCTSCDANSIQLSIDGFSKISDPKATSASVSIRMVSCKTEEDIIVALNQGSSATALSFKVIGSRIGVSKLEIAAEMGSSWQSATRSSSNNWEVSPSAAISGAFNVRLTATTDVTTVATFNVLAENATASAEQFPDVPFRYGNSSLDCCSAPDSADKPSVTVFDEITGDGWEDWSSDVSQALDTNSLIGNSSLMVNFSAGGRLVFGSKTHLAVSDYFGLSFWIKAQQSTGFITIAVEGSKNMTIELSDDWQLVAFDFGSAGVTGSIRQIAFSSENSCTVNIDELTLGSSDTSSGLCAEEVDPSAETEAYCQVQTPTIYDANDDPVTKRSLEESSFFPRGSGSLTLTGVNLAGADFGGNILPGVYGTNYIYPTTSEVDYFVKKGFNVFRVPFLWERVQRSLGATFDTTEFGRLTTLANYITAKGAYALLDPHNYARYNGNLIGSSSVSIDQFADFWSKMATYFKSNNKIIFALMNEPNGIKTETWFSAAQAAITAIRATGATSQYIIAPGNAWTGATSWTQTWYGTSNANAWNLKDSAGLLMVDIHQYLDSDYSGSDAACKSGAGSSVLSEFTSWARSKGLKAVITEIGVGANDLCKTEITNFFNYMTSNTDVYFGFTWWAAGPWWADYRYTIEPNSDGSDKTQMSYITPYLAGTSGGSTPSTQTGWTTAEANTILSLHNSARSAVGAANLQWDSALASQAQSYAAKCNANLNTARVYSGSSNVGELIFTSSSASATPASLMNDFLSSKSLYTLSSNTCNGDCTKYKQVIWCGTTKVGCGVYHCGSITGSSISSGVVAVCDYYTAGNVAGSSPVCSSSCTPKTCSSMGKSCGTWSNGCGNNLNCGTCSSGTCSSTGLCSSCVAKTCSSMGKSCGTWDDGCGSKVTCSSCASGYTCSSSGTCAANPSCTPTATCGTRKCGTIWDGCKTVKCGSCSSSKTCSTAGKCVKKSSKSKSSSRRSTDSAVWTISVDDISEVAQDGVEHKMEFIGSVNCSDADTAISSQVSASEGVIGLGLRLGQGTGRESDMIAIKISISNSTAAVCQTQLAVETCVVVKNGVAFSTSDFNNLTVEAKADSSTIHLYSWLNGVSMTGDKPFPIAKSLFPQTGEALLISQSLSPQTFRSTAVSTKNFVQIQTSECITESQMEQFTSCAVASSGSVKATGKTSCGTVDTSNKKRAAGAPGYSSFLLEVSDEVGTSSETLSVALVDSVAAGSASAAGITVATAAAVLPELAAGASSAALSTGAIIGIAVGGGCGLIAIAGISAGVAVAARKRSSSDSQPAPAATEKPGMARRTIARLFGSGAVDVMDTSGKEHSSITNRGVAMTGAPITAM